MSTDYEADALTITDIGGATISYYLHLAFSSYYCDKDVSIKKVYFVQKTGKKQLNSIAKTLKIWTCVNLWKVTRL